VAEVHRDGDAPLPRDTETTIATMSNLPAGSYVISGKTTVVRLAGGENPEILCTLDTGTVTDTAAGDGQKDDDYFTLPTQLAVTFGGTGTVTLHCMLTGSNATFVARATKIIALMVGTVTADPVVG
jgi:hypothetical protein